MAKKKESNKKEDMYSFAFANELEPVVYRKYIAAVISANIQEKVPAHMRRPLLDEFVRDGHILPGSPKKT